MIKTVRVLHGIKDEFPSGYLKSKSKTKNKNSCFTQSRKYVRYKHKNFPLCIFFRFLIEHGDLPPAIFIAALLIFLRFQFAEKSIKLVTNIQFSVNCNHSIYQ